MRKNQFTSKVKAMKPVRYFYVVYWTTVGPYSECVTTTGEYVNKQALEIAVANSLPESVDSTLVDRKCMITNIVEMSKGDYSQFTKFERTVPVMTGKTT